LFDFSSSAIDAHFSERQVLMVFCAGHQPTTTDEYQHRASRRTLALDMPRLFRVHRKREFASIPSLHIFSVRIRARFAAWFFEQPGYFSTADFMMNLFQ